MDDFFGFRDLVTPSLVKGAYVVGAVLATVLGVAGGVFTEQVARGWGFMGGLALVLVLNLAWRVYCELMIIVFSIHDRLVEISDASAPLSATSGKRAKASRSSGPYEGGVVSDPDALEAATQAVAREGSVARDGVPLADPGNVVLEADEPMEAVLRDQITAMSASIKAAGADADAATIFQLGRLWALLFDETGDAQHRGKALRAMQRAREIDASAAQVDFYDELGFGSLMTDPEFAGFGR